MLILGALTPLAALGIAGTMITATIFLIQRGEPFINPAGHSWENSAFYLTVGLCLALSGAGPLVFGCMAVQAAGGIILHWTLIESLGARRADRRASRRNSQYESPCTH